jgi:hypothetical protein
VTAVPYVPDVDVRVRADCVALATVTVWVTVPPDKYVF